VACVSRLIGNSDSTGKAIVWQEGVWGGTALSNKPGKIIVSKGEVSEPWLEMSPDARNATLLRVAFK